MKNKNHFNISYKLLFFLITIILITYYLDFNHNTNPLSSLTVIYCVLLLINKSFESLYISLCCRLSNLSINYIIFKFFILYKTNNSWCLKKKKAVDLSLSYKYNINIPLCNNKKSLLKLKKSTNIMFICFLIISSIIPLSYIFLTLYYTNKISFILPSLICIIFNANISLSGSLIKLKLFDSYANLLTIATNSTIKHNKFSCYSSNELLNNCITLSECINKKQITTQLLINENILTLKLHNLIEAIPSCFYDNINYLLINKNIFLSDNFVEHSFRLYYLICIHLHKVEKNSYAAIELFSYVNSIYSCKYNNDIILKNTVAYVLGFKHNLENILDSYIFEFVDNKNKERVYIEDLRSDLICSLV